MTVLSTVNRFEYTGNGAQTTFPYSRKVFSTSEVQVYVAGVLQASGYTVTGVGSDTGGNVVFSVAPVNGSAVLILLVESATQETSLPTSGPFPAKTVEAALDKETMLIQQLQETDRRALKLAVTSLYTNLAVPDPQSGLVLRWKSDLSGLENASVTGQGAITLPIGNADGGTGFTTYTKGDLLQGNAGVGLSKLAIGTDTYHLEADSSQATGAKWALPAEFGQTRLVYVSGTQIKLNPYNGNKIPVKTSGAWRLRSVGSGLASADPTAAANYVNGVAAQTLSTNTTYLVTVFDNAGTLTFDFLTALAHAADATTGVEIKSGDDTRTVVGMVRTNGTPNFQYDYTLLGVRSWFNRASAVAFQTYSNGAAGNTALIGVGTAIGFVAFSDDTVCGTEQGLFSSGGVAGGNVTTQMLIDTVGSTEYTLVGVTAAGAGFTNGCVLCARNLADGYHTYQMGMNNAGLGSNININLFLDFSISR